MRSPIPVDELFIGAVVRHKDIDSYTAVVTRLHDGLVDVADVYGWNENNNFSPDTVFPLTTLDYALVRFGFERNRDVTTHKVFRLETLEGVLSVVSFPDGWVLNVGRSTIEIESAHHLQAVCRTLYNVDLSIIKEAVVNGEDEQD